MSEHPVMLSEEERLAALGALGILDTPPEAMFDEIVRAAALVAQRPISLMSLVDASRHWFKANVGLDGVSEAPREYAFCELVVQDRNVLEVADARLDSRFSASPLVTGSANIRAYTGVPIALEDGTTLGALCVMGTQPGRLSAEQVRILTHLGRVAGLALAQRAELLRGRDAAKIEAAHARELRDHAVVLQKEIQSNEQFMRRTGRVAGVGGWELDIETSRVRWSEQTCRIHELPVGYASTLDEGLNFYAPAARSLLKAAIDVALRRHLPWDLELPLVTAKGRPIWVRIVGAVELEDGVPVKLSGALQDVTDRRRAMDALEASERRYRKLFQYSLGLICTHGLDGIVLAVNPATATSLGYATGEIIGRSLAEFMRPERRPRLAVYLARIEEHRIDSGMLELVARDGTLRYWRYQNVLDTEADEPYVLGHAQDVTEQQNYEKTLLEWSTTDPLTHAKNRRYIAELKPQLMCSPGWACIAIDIDHFKQVNDTHGHQRGDELLLTVAGLLRGACDGDDTVIRMGGDEFLVIVRDPARTAQIIDTIADRQSVAGVSLSVGAATAVADESFDSVVARADQQLYAHRQHTRRSERH